MSKLSETLESGKFAVTCELNPPKGVDLAPLYQKVDLLGDLVDAVNITDSASSRMTMGNIAVAHFLLDKGVEPILQITCRDRNRLALQAELLAAHSLGITNLLCMTGDPPGGGDHPDAKPVFDLSASELLRATKSLQSGQDIAGNDLKGAPSFFSGAVVNPGAKDIDVELRRMEEKIEAGAMFFQTQAIYEPRAFENFISTVRHFGVPILAGIVVLKSGNMARFLNEKVPGIQVPDQLIRDMDEAENRGERSVEISAQIIREIRNMCNGVHIMAIGWETRITQIVEAADIAVR